MWRVYHELAIWSLSVLERKGLILLPGIGTDLTMARPSSGDLLALVLSQKWRHFTILFCILKALRYTAIPNTITLAHPGCCTILVKAIITAVDCLWPCSISAVADHTIRDICTLFDSIGWSQICEWTSCVQIVIINQVQSALQHFFLAGTIYHNSFSYITSCMSLLTPIWLSLCGVSTCKKLLN